MAQSVFGFQSVGGRGLPKSGGVCAGRPAGARRYPQDQFSTSQTAMESPLVVGGCLVICPRCHKLCHKSSIYIVESRKQAVLFVLSSGLELEAGEAGGAFLCISSDI